MKKNYSSSKSTKSTKKTQKSFEDKIIVYLRLYHNCCTLSTVLQENAKIMIIEH